MPRRAACQCGTCPGCRNRARVARWQREHPDKYAEKTRRYRTRKLGRHHHAARQKVWRALESGDLIRPNECERCGAPPPLDAHHHDYDKPLDVVWLCGRCHNDAHQEDAA